jgi:hypothetical protein
VASLDEARACLAFLGPARPTGSESRSLPNESRRWALPSFPSFLLLLQVADVSWFVLQMGFDPSQYRLDIADLANQEKTEAGLLAAVVRRIVTGGGIGSSGSNRRW